MPLLPIAVAALLILSALLAASETALFALVRMEGTRSKLSTPVQQALARLMSRPLESLIVVIGLNETVNVFAECLATSFLLFWAGPAGVYISVALMLALILIFCEITPKTLALAFPATVAQITARPLATLAGFTHPAARIFAPKIEPARPEPLSETEFKALLQVSEKQGEVESGERELIHRIFEFGSRLAADVMTPYDRLFMLDIETAAASLIAEVTRGHFSRVPIYEGSRSNVVGVLHAKDLAVWRSDANSASTATPSLRAIMRKPYFVSGRKLLSALFDEMRAHRVHLAMVNDDRGQLAGLLTLEDLLEELFGEIRDEFEFAGPELQRVADNEWLVSGAIELARLERALGAKLASRDRRRSLSSAVLRSLKRVPRQGEHFRLEPFHATAERVRGATVELLRLKR